MYMYIQRARVIWRFYIVPNIFLHNSNMLNGFLEIYFGGGPIGSPNPNLIRGQWDAKYVMLVSYGGKLNPKTRKFHIDDYE